MSELVSRRALLRAVVATAALLAGGTGVKLFLEDRNRSSTTRLPQSTSSSKSRSQSTVASQLHSAPQSITADELSAIALVGRRYVDGPASRLRVNVKSLLASLRRAGVDTSDMRRVRGLSVAARKDFADGDTVFVDGWMMSRAEAEFAALVYLNQPTG